MKGTNEGKGRKCEQIQQESRKVPTEEQRVAERRHPVRGRQECSVKMGGKDRGYSRGRLIEKEEEAQGTPMPGAHLRQKDEQNVGNQESSLPICSYVSPLSTQLLILSKTR